LYSYKTTKHFTLKFQQEKKSETESRPDVEIVYENVSHNLQKDDIIKYKLAIDQLMQVHEKFVGNYQAGNQLLNMLTNGKNVMERMVYEPIFES